MPPFVVVASVRATAAAFACTFACACVSACAAAPPTWDEVGASSAGDDNGGNAGNGGDDRRSVSNGGGGGTAGTSAAALPGGGTSAGLLIDEALQRFSSDRVAARGSPKTSGVWGEGWDRVLTTVGAACEIAPSARDLGAFVRARVTLEVELERDRERDVLLPAHLDQRIAAVLGAVDESVGELRAANAPGTIAPSPRIEEGDLVLRAPLAPMVISSPFGVRADPFTTQKRFHNGVDLDAPMGSVVWAAASGLVVYAGLQGGYGKQVVIDHGDGVRTHYSHLSQILVSPGQSVAEGDTIAYVGSTGRSTGPHLHFAVTTGPDFIDPVAVIDIPFTTIARQVRVGTEKERRTFALRKGDDDDTIIIDAVPSSRR